MEMNLMLLILQLKTSSRINPVPIILHGLKVTGHFSFHILSWFYHCSVFSAFFCSLSLVKPHSHRSLDWSRSLERERKFLNYDWYTRDRHCRWILCKSCIGDLWHFGLQIHLQLLNYANAPCWYWKHKSYMGPYRNILFKLVDYLIFKL